MGNLSKAYQKRIDHFRRYITDELLPDVCQLYPATGGTKTVSPSGIITSSAPVAKQWLNPRGTTTTQSSLVVNADGGGAVAVGMQTGGSTARVAQSIIITTTSTLASITLKLGKLNNPAPLFVSIVHDSANKPDTVSAPLKTVSYTSSVFTPDNVIPIGVVLTPGTYWIMFEVLTFTENNWWAIYRSNASSYPSGSFALDSGPFGAYAGTWEAFGTTIYDMRLALTLETTTPGVLVTDIPCRLDASRAFRPEHMKFEVTTANEISLELPWDAPVIATDRVTVMTRLGATRKFEIRKVTEGSNNDGTIVCLIEEITADYDHD